MSLTSHLVFQKHFCSRRCIMCEETQICRSLEAGRGGGSEGTLRFGAVNVSCSKGGERTCRSRDIQNWAANLGRYSRELRLNCSITSECRPTHSQRSPPHGHYVHSVWGGGAALGGFQCACPSVRSNLSTKERLPNRKTLIWVRQIVFEQQVLLFSHDDDVILPLSSPEKWRFLSQKQKRTSVRTRKCTAHLLSVTWSTSSISQYIEPTHFTGVKLFPLPKHTNSHTRLERIWLASKHTEQELGWVTQIKLKLNLTSVGKNSD